MALRYRLLLVATFLVAFAGCDQLNSRTEMVKKEATQLAQAVVSDTASIFGGFERFTKEDVARARKDDSWRKFVTFDTTATPKPAGLKPKGFTEKWSDIIAARVNESKEPVELYGDIAGPSVLRAQILLDRAKFSPGQMDGYWGANSEKAVYWLQKRERLPATGRLDANTYRRLYELAGLPDSTVVEYTLTAEDVRGPFRELPEDEKELAGLDSVGYESLSEKLGELFHVTPEVLEQLNPGEELDSLKAGDGIRVPNVRYDSAARDAPVVRIVVSGGGRYLHALDQSGRILYHFPTSLGSTYQKTPSGQFQVKSTTKNPVWLYRPDSTDAAQPLNIPPGPNNAVGSVWMALTKPHYGIHGTNAPEMIGTNTSSGCVRLTNWDALFLSGKVRNGVPVQIRDTGSLAEARPAGRRG